MKTTLRAALCTLSSFLVSDRVVVASAEQATEAKEQNEENTSPIKRTYFQAYASKRTSSQDLSHGEAQSDSLKSDSLGSAKKNVRYSSNQHDLPEDHEDRGMLTQYSIGGHSSFNPPASGASFEGNTEGFDGFPLPATNRLRAADSRRVRRSNEQKKHISRKVAKAGDAGADIGLTDNGCFRGPEPLVMAFCLAGQCCQGEDACVWPSGRIATVCPFSCNGDRACQYIGEGVSIGWNACTGKRACEDLGDGSTVGFRSCYGDYACQEAAKLGTASIGNRACYGDASCSEICEFGQMCELTINDFACEGEYACYNAARSASSIEKISIGDGACYTPNDSKAGGCQFIGYTNSKTIEIGDYSCAADRGCYYMGRHAETVKVGDYSCSAESACEYVGYYSQEDVNVGDNACTSDSSCQELGKNTLKKVTIEDAACTASGACSEFGKDIGTGSFPSADIKVSKSECTAANECSGLSIAACLSTAKVPNKAGVCPVS